jgi:hypothetical protein
MILFFIRRFNDVDHTVPMIHAVQQKSREDIRVISLNPALNLAEDVRLGFLRDKRVRIDHATEVLRENCLERAGHYISRWLVNRLSTHSLAGWVDRRFGMGAWARRLIQQLKPSVLVFDWQEPEKTLALQIQQAAKKQNIPMLATPHGMQLMMNDLVTTQASESGEATSWGHFLRYIDRVVAPFELQAQWFERCGVPREKLVVLGSARFCPAWRDIYAGLIANAPNSGPAQSDKVKVVYMDHVAAYRIHPEIVEATLTRIAALDFVDLVIKPSTGANAFSSPALKEISGAVEEVSSITLIDWADVVIGSISSILIEALAADKPLIYPIHHSNNDSMFTARGACLSVATDEDLEAALAQHHADPTSRLYPKEAAGAFLTEVVMGGDANNNVLDNYASFVLSGAKGTNDLPLKGPTKVAQ